MRICTPSTHLHVPNEQKMLFACMIAKHRILTIFSMKVFNLLLPVIFHCLPSALIYKFHTFVLLNVSDGVVFYALGCCSVFRTGSHTVCNEIASCQRLLTNIHTFLHEKRSDAGGGSTQRL